MARSMSGVLMGSSLIAANDRLASIGVLLEMCGQFD